jgi:hypothetical protein
MKRGYIRLYRKIDECAVLQERNKRYSKKEAWIHLVMNEAAGLPRDGLQRGEFEVSVRHLARKWNWSKTSVERFLTDLERCEDPMIKRVGHFAGHFAGHFIICKYDIYNPTRDTLRDTLRDTYKINIKQDKEKESCQLSADPSALFEIYESENKKLPQVQVRSGDRSAKCRSRINQAIRNGCLEQYLSDFRAAVQKAQQTPFLCGQKGWRANFDWFIANHTNIYAVLEGKYDSSAEATLPYKRDTVGQSDECDGMSAAELAEERRKQTEEMFGG